MKSYKEGSNQLSIPFFKKPVMGKEPNDPQPGYIGLQTPFTVEDDEMSMDDALSSSASASFTD
jgi:hypothetical protein